MGQTNKATSLILLLLVVAVTGCAGKRAPVDARVESMDTITNVVNNASDTATDEQSKDENSDEDEQDDEFDEDEFDDDEFDDLDEEFSDRDPLEGFNRFVYGFNNQADRFVLRPVAKQYARLPGFFKNRVNSFFSNLNEPTTVANDVLQGKWLQAVEDSTRFVVNSTAGVLGIFDVASHVDLPKNDEDFGQTLGRWGVGEGPYVMLPLLGPSSLRDSIALVPEFIYTDPVSHIDNSGAQLATRAVQVTDTRAGLLRADKLLDMQLDPYVFLRESYRQKRAEAINDGDDAE